jgi:hypothetical protein
MTFKPYPKWITTPAGVRMIVESAEDEAVQMVEPEKKDEVPVVPVLEAAPEAPVVPEPEAPAVENILAKAPDRAALLARAGELGIKVDNRWGDARIASEIASAK